MAEGERFFKGASEASETRMVPFAQSCSPIGCDFQSIRNCSDHPLRSDVPCTDVPRSTFCFAAQAVLAAVKIFRKNCDGHDSRHDKRSRGKQKTLVMAGRLSGTAVSR